MALTLTQKQQQLKTRLLRKFHALLSKTANPEQAKEEILLSLNVASSKYLTINQLMTVCDALDDTVSPQAAEMDKWRKRLIAAIGGWLRALNKVENINLIKGIACRASGKGSLNAIPLEQLRSLYYTFRNKATDIASVDDLTAIELDYLSILN